MPGEGLLRLREPPTLCPGRKAGAVVVRGLTADRNGPTKGLILRASRWIAGCSGAAGARAMDAARVINSNAQLFGIETWAGGTWRRTAILACQDNA